MTQILCIILVAYITYCLLKIYRKKICYGLDFLATRVRQLNDYIRMDPQAEGSISTLAKLKPQHPDEVRETTTVINTYDKEVLDKILDLRNDYKKKHGKYPNEIIITREMLGRVFSRFGERNMGRADVNKILGMSVIRDPSTHNIKVRFTNRVRPQDERSSS